MLGASWWRAAGGVVAAVAVVLGAVAGAAGREQGAQPAPPAGVPGAAGAVGPGVGGPRVAGDRPPSLPREFRGVWVATVNNIDWPSARGMPVAAARAEMERLLDLAARLNLNAVVLQVRPCADAMYPSELEPWSEFLTGRSGQPPSEAGYDPLAEWIAGAHARGLELHAWVNPFRSRHPGQKAPDALSHVNVAQPGWVRDYAGGKWMDPGEPAAREHSLAVILDLVRRYDLDGVHYDDYFYPYPDGAKPFPDDTTYGAYTAAGGRLSREEWRRDNINSFVRRLYEGVKRLKPHVKVGASPFGIWRPGFPPGIRGFDAYDKLAADARLWLREGWIDYIAPQLYWPVDQKPQSYERLLDWWIANNDRGRHVWVGNYASRVLPAPGGTGGGGAAPGVGGESAATTDAKGRPSWEPSEIVRQIELTRLRGDDSGGAAGASTGNIHFSAVALLQNRRGLADALVSGPYASPAIVPASPWLAPAGSTPPAAPGLTVALVAGGAAEVVAVPGPGTSHLVVWSRRVPAEGAAPGGARWQIERVLRATPGQAVRWPVPARTASPAAGAADRLAVTPLDRFGRAGEPAAVAAPGR